MSKSLKFVKSVRGKHKAGARQGYRFDPERKFQPRYPADIYKRKRTTKKKKKKGKFWRSMQDVSVGGNTPRSVHLDSLVRLAKEERRVGRVIQIKKPTRGGGGVTQTYCNDDDQVEVFSSSSHNHGHVSSGPF